MTPRFEPRPYFYAVLAAAWLAVGLGPRSGDGRTGRAAISFAPATLIVASPASAHALAERYDLPVPLGLYLGAAGAIVALSFVLLALFARRIPPAADYPRVDLAAAPGLRSIVYPWLRGGAGAVGLAVFVLIAATSFYGNQDGLKNLAPVAVWVVWWVGLAFIAALIGNPWRALNPWRTAFQLAERLFGPQGTARTPPLTYPGRLATWPAVALFFIFIWLELVWEDSERPASLGTAIIAYSGLTWAGMFAFGCERWLSAGEIFSVFFTTLGRFAPISGGGDDPDPPWTLRPWGVGLIAGGPVDVSMMAFVVAMLASVTLDGFFETPPWAAVLATIADAAEDGAYARLAEWVGLSPGALATSAALVGGPLLLLGVYGATTGLMARAADAAKSSGEIARTFLRTLVPIAIAYHFAHYLSYLLFAGQFIIPLASDPFGLGWDLFGTTLYRIDIGVIDARAVWFVALSAIVLGHVAALILAHVAAIRRFGPGPAALRSQYPMLALMILYTMSSLWILAQPIVVTRG